MNASKVLELVNNNELTKLAELAKKEIQENEIKKKYGVSELKRTKLALKYLKNSKSPTSYDLKNIAWIFDGKQFFSNGYTGFIFEKHIQDLPYDENRTKAGEFEKLTNLFLNFCRTENKKRADFDISDIRTTLKIQKAEHKERCEYDIGEFTYDTKHLIDCIEILGGEI